MTVEVASHPIKLAAEDVLSRFSSSGRRRKKIEGVWTTPDRESRVTIISASEDGNNVMGYVSWLKDSDKALKRDRRNPVPALRERKLLGLPILTNFTRAQQEGDSCWEKGQIYDPQNGWKVNGRLKMNEEGDKLYVKGWVGVGPL